jgi:uncharacterized protein YwqG
LVLPEQPLEGVLGQSYPGYLTPELESLALREEEEELYEEYTESLIEDDDFGHLLGWPDGILQGDPRNCACSQRAEVRNAFGEPPRSESPEELVTLLQIDESDGLEWGDCGTAYVVVRRDDLANGKFDDAWLVVYQ